MSRDAAGSALRRPLTVASAHLVGERLQLVAQPLRIMLIDRLQRDQRAVHELADELGVTQQNVSKHLKRLVEGEVVARHPVGREVVYALRPHAAWTIIELAATRLGPSGPSSTTGAWR